MKYLWIVCALSVIASIVIFQQLPEGAEVPVHWGADGTADRYAPAWKGLLMPPALMILMLGVFSGLKWVEPRQENLNKSLRARDGFALAIVLMALVLQVGTIASLTGLEVPKSRLVVLGGGLALLIMGNFMGKTRSNFFIGLQTPWTLASEDIWRKTHRFGGKLQMFAGAVMIIAAWVMAEESFKYVTLVIVLPTIFIPMVYSWWLWRQEQIQKSPE